MIAFLIAFATETARILYEASLYILIGFLIAGLLQEFLPGATIARHLGAESWRSVAARRAARPRAPALLVRRRAGGGVAAAARARAARRSPSFLISTPETGEEADRAHLGPDGSGDGDRPPDHRDRHRDRRRPARCSSCARTRRPPTSPRSSPRDEHGHVHGLDDDAAAAPRAWRERVAHGRSLRLPHARRRPRLLAALRHRADRPALRPAPERLLLARARLGSRHRADARDDGGRRAALSVRERVDAGRRRR